MTLDSFTALLEGVKQTPRGMVALCRAHGDKTPSLGVSEGSDGRILLHCWAGCTAAEIVGAMGLTLADLFPDRTTSREEITHDRREREANQAAEKARRHRAGLQIDARREADTLIQSRKGLCIAGWSDQELHDELATLASAYETLWGEFLDER